MDPKRFDRIARAIGSAKLGRRNLAGAVLGAGGLAAVYRLVVAQPACAGDGQSCTLMSGCCDGFVCNVSLMNPNFGTCLAGEDTLGTGWTFGGLAALPAVATEIARERRRRKGRNKKRNANKRARSTATPTTVPAATSVPTSVPQTPTPTGTVPPTAEPTWDPSSTPTTSYDVDIQLQLDCALDDLTKPEITRIRNTGRTPVTITIIKGSSNMCYYPNGDIGVGETFTFRSGQGTDNQAYLYTGVNPSVRVQVAYVSVPGASPAWVTFRATCGRDGTDRLSSEILNCS